MRCRATEMDVTMIGLQNAGKTSLLRVLAVSENRKTRLTKMKIAVADNSDPYRQGGEFAIE